MDEKTQETIISQVLDAVKIVEDKFRKIQENPALHGAENGFSKDELKLLERLISITGEVSIATDAIIKRY